MHYLTQLSFAQWLGFLSFALGILAFYQKNDKRLKIIMLIYQLNNVFHFYLLGSNVSALTNVFSFLRTGAAIKSSSKKVAAFFITLTVVIGILIAKTPLDILPILGSTIGTVGVFLLKGIKMRIAFIMGGMCWLANNIIVGSIGGTLLEATLLTVNLFTISRLYRHEKKLAQAIRNHQD